MPFQRRSTDPDFTFANGIKNFDFAAATRVLTSNEKMLTSWCGLIADPLRVAIDLSALHEITFMLKVLISCAEGELLPEINLPSWN